VFPLVVFLATIAIAIAIAWSQPALADRVRWMFTVALAALAIVPVAAGIAVLRFRLYDIDVVIRRTIVYSAVVAILGASYLALVVALQSALTLLGGNDGLPVALSTLMIAAIFVPVRARARRIVDRRFYRSRYDAQRTVESFAGRLRDQVELEAVRQELSVAAGEAVRPASIGVWVRARGRP
jgi:amino acid transporter